MMPLTRREALIRAAGAASVFALNRVARSPAQQASVIPPEVVTLEDFEAFAKLKLPGQIYEGVRGGAADEITIRWNREAFNNIALRSRVLVDVSELDTRLTLFGQALNVPIVLAPAGVHGLLHPEGELETARGASKAGVTLVVPFSPSRPVEEIARTTSQPPWYQVYIAKDRGMTRAEAQRAEAVGCRVLFVTVGGGVPGVRNWLMRPPFDPVATPGQLRTIVDSAVTWKDIAWLRSLVKIPIVLKGVMDPEDADRAVKEGVGGISVSNHGGRQLDTAAATIDALPAVIEKVAGRIPVLMDGGVRRGTDVMKALARGASAVMICRPFLYGLGVAGAAGVERVVTILREEFEIAMALTGRPSLADIDQSVLF
jgi:4-hydroxymandelate oxidase